MPCHPWISQRIQDMLFPCSARGLPISSGPACSSTCSTQGRKVPWPQSQPNPTIAATRAGPTPILERLEPCADDQSTSPSTAARTIIHQRNPTACISRTVGSVRHAPYLCRSSPQLRMQPAVGPFGVSVSAPLLQNKEISG